MKFKIKNKLILIAAVFFVSTFTSCQEYLDVNTTPNAPSESELKYTFPSALNYTAGVVGGRWQMLGAIWSQHWTSEPNAPNYQLIDSYALTSGDITVANWRTLYSGALPDYKWVRERAELDENWNYYLMATVMEAYTYQVLVDLYDKVPYSDALLQHPAKFDDGAAVYDGIIAQIDDALAKYYAGAESVLPENDDIVFHGNMASWIQFAYTMKLKIYLRQIYVPSRKTIAEDGIRRIYNEINAGSGRGFLTTDASFLAFTEEAGKENPVFSMEWRGGSTNIVASKTLLNYLIDKNDPRLSKIYEKPQGSSSHKGMLQGDYRNSDLQTAKFSECIVTETQPVFFISEAESYFLQAEAALRGLGDGNAKALYQKAVQANCDRLDAGSASSITGSGRYAEFKDDASDSENFETLMMQKWIAFANVQGLEAFLETTRTGTQK